MTLPDSYALTLPNEWDQLPVDDKGFDEAIVELRKAASEGGASLTTVRRAEAMLQGVRNDLATSKVTFAGYFVEDATSDEDAEFYGVPEAQPSSITSVLMAVCTISTVTRGDVEASIPITVDALVAAQALVDMPRDQRGRRTSTDLEPVATVDLEPGPAVLARRYETVELQQRFEMAMYTEQYLIPIAEGEAFVVVNFATPCVEYATEFAGLFESIAQTLRVLYRDQPTFESPDIDDNNSPVNIPEDDDLQPIGHGGGRGH